MALLPANDGALLQEHLTDFTMETRGVSPAHLLVQIESFSLLSKHKIKKYESREFEAGDYKWRLIIHFDENESTEKEGGHISAYLCMSDTASLPVDWEVDAMFSIFLYNQILDNYLCFRGKLQRFHATNPKWGFSKMISKKSLTEPSNGYIVDDHCVFGAEVFVVKSQRVIERMSLLNSSKGPYKDYWTYSQFSKFRDVRYSQEFDADGYKWKIMLYPNGNGKGTGRSISIFMELVDSKSFGPHQKVNAHICLRIRNKLGSTYNTRSFSTWYASSVTNWGYPEFISIADMQDPKKGFLGDDCCYLDTEISVQAVVPDETRHLSEGIQVNEMKGFSKLFNCFS